MEQKKGPWTMKSSELKYKNPWIEVREDKVIRPDGRDGICGVVTMKSGVSVLPLDDENNVYLTEEYHYGVERVTLEVVSGGVDQGESLLDAAKRELQEEIGCTASDWIDLQSIDPFTTVVVSPNHLFLARGLTHGHASPEGTESIVVKKVPFPQVVDWAMNGTITHGASVAVILKAAIYLSGSRERRLDTHS